MNFAAATDFATVKARELAEIRNLRRARGGPDSGDDCLGLAFSGGGIRSATFNLGILQTLAELKILRCVDYLSTVSGGGYIGSWLLAWLKRQSFATVEAWLKPDWKNHPDPRQPACPIEFLRDYSNYLTPQVGLLTADTWTAIEIFVRNLLLNLAILISAGIALLLLPYPLVHAVAYSHAGIKSLVISQILLTAGYGMFIYHFRQADVDVPKASRPGATPGRILLSILPLWFVGIYLEVRCFSACPGRFGWAIGGGAWWQTQAFWASVAVVAFWFVVGISIGWIKISGRDPHRQVSTTAGFVLSIVSYLVLSFFCTVWALAYLAHRWPLHGFALATFGVPLVMLVYQLTAALQVGLSGLSLRNQAREWTARLAAWIIIICLFWAVLFSIVIYGPFAALRLGAWVSGTVTLAWIAHTASGVWSAFNSHSGNKSSTNWRDLLVVTAAPVFVLGLLLLLSFGIYRIGVPATPASLKATSSYQVQVTVGGAADSATVNVASTPAPASKLSLADYAAQLQSGRVWGLKWRLVWVALGFLLVAILLSLRVDINEFAMNTFYRNRLVRCYLGASRPPDDGTDPCRRKPNPFTGFDPLDDLMLESLRTGAPPEVCSQPYAGPYPIINAALNLTHGRRLAWQERKAESFTFTPLFCGGTISDEEKYLPTGEYAYPPYGVYLGTAMAVSGAAVSPLIGFHYSPAAGFLLTVFNARLGQWLANPASPATWNRFGPRLGLYWLTKELLGLTDDRAPYVQLSDGGHFENLGIYELVRRRCRYIIACDSGADPEFTFENLGDAIRKCRSDFGAEFSLNVESLRADPATMISKVHFVFGDITYVDGTRGSLLYIKSSLVTGDPTDVLEYHREHEEFPHQSTVDQWFTESQFESYRKLGEYAANAAWKQLGTNHAWREFVTRIPT